MNTQDHVGTESNRHQHGQIVQISFNGSTVSIPDGVYKVSELKQRFGVPAEYVLNEIDKHGSIKPLPNERSIHVQGGETFVSQPPQGGSS